MALHKHDVEHLRSVFLAVENGDIGMLKSLGIKVANRISFNILYLELPLNCFRTPNWEMLNFSLKS